MISRDTPRWLLCVIFGAPLLLLIAAIYTFNPALAGQTKGLVQSVVGSHGSPKEWKENPAFNPDKAFFQADVVYLDPPTFKDIKKLSEYPPRNYRGPGHDVFATFFATRNATPHDPYYLAAQQFIYRLLWDERTKSEEHPVVVFVAPFVTEEQRQQFTAAGALVRELGLHNFVPEKEGLPGRLQDMFSKLEMWRQTDFRRIAYLDSDAFPFDKVDELFALAPEQMCDSSKLPRQDRKLITSICNYVFAAYFEEAIGSINAGVMVFEPNVAMHKRLKREIKNREGWSEVFLEQALLNKLFGKDGPFPPTLLEHKWNAGEDVKANGEDYRIIHTKIWADYWADTPFFMDNFNDTGRAMNALYASDEFEKLRQADLDKAVEGFTKPS